MTEQRQPGECFEREVAKAFRRMGARKVAHDVLLAGNQIDVYVELPLGSGMVHRIAVEAKDHKSKVGIKLVNNFVPVADCLRRAHAVDEGVLVSSRGFTKPAREAAREHHMRLLAFDDLQAMAERAESPNRIGPVVPLVPSPPTPYLVHGSPLQKHFAGRLDERCELTEWLVRDEHTIMVLVAIGGMGKSCLAWVWAMRDVMGTDVPDIVPSQCASERPARVQDAKRPEGLFWWSFYEGGGTYDGFLEAAIGYCSSGERTVQDYASPSSRGGYVIDHDRMQLDLIQLLQQREILLIWDGAERILREYTCSNADPDEEGDSDQIAPSARTPVNAAVERFWQAMASQSSSHLLLTSRVVPEPLERLAGGRIMRLGGLDEQDAVAYLQACGISGSRDELVAAAGQYECHALSVNNLAAHLLDDFQKMADISAAPRYDETKTLRAKHHHVLELAYQRRTPRRRELLSHLSAVRGNIPANVVQLLADGVGIPADQLSEDLKELTRHGLLHRASTDAYGFHPIVRAFCYKNLQNKEKVHSALQRHFLDAPKADFHQVKSVQDLHPWIELYYHTALSGKGDVAISLFSRSLHRPLYYQLGAYQTCIEFLQVFFPEADCAPSGLREKASQAWALVALANAYSAVGSPSRAVPLFQEQIAIRRNEGNPKNVAIGLNGIAIMAYLPLGRLRAAEESLQEALQLSRAVNASEDVSSWYYDLGLVLAYCGRFDQSDECLLTAWHMKSQEDNVQALGVVKTLQAIRSLLVGNAPEAVEAAMEARRLATAAGEAHYPIEADFARAEWLLGASKMALYMENTDKQTRFLEESESHLLDALSRCRKIGLIETEGQVLLALAKLRRAQGSAKASEDKAQEALRVAQRSDYRLQQADVHNLLAMLALDEGHRAKARQHAETASERALCDGLPHHAYKRALEEATGLLSRTE